MNPHSRLLHPTRRDVLLAGAAGASSLLLPGSASAQAPWPTRPVKILISFPPGGSSDFIARQLAPFLAEQLGQPFVVDNRPGAGGMIAAEAIKKEPADGYNFIISNNAPFSIAPTQFKTVNYDVMKDFTHIAFLGTVYGGCVANPKLGVKNLVELVAKARANPGKITYGSSGTGSIGHIFGSAFCRATKVDMLHVPYKGAGPLRQDLLGGTVDTAFESVTGSLPFLKAGTLVALGSASAERLEPIADVPTFREQGFDLLSENWHGISAPAGLPAPIVTRLSSVLSSLMQRKDVLDKIATYGVFYKPMADFKGFVAAQVDQWRPWIIAAGIAGQ